MIIAKRNLPNAAYNCAMRRVVNRNALVELRIRGIQKRHLLAHRMGVIDDAYLEATGDNRALLGRRISVSTDEVQLGA